MSWCWTGRSVLWVWVWTEDKVKVKEHCRAFVFLWNLNTSCRRWIWEVNMAVKQMWETKMLLEGTNGTKYSFCQKLRRSRRNKWGRRQSCQPAGTSLGEIKSSRGLVLFGPSRFKVVMCLTFSADGLPWHSLLFGSCVTASCFFSSRIKVDYICSHAGRHAMFA